MKRISTVLAALTICTAVMAETPADSDTGCHLDLDLHHDISVNPHQLQVLDKDTVLYTMNRDGRLWIGADEAELTADQHELVGQYTGQVVETIPKVYALVSTALEAAGMAIGVAFAGLFGEDSEVAQKTEEVMLQARNRFDAVAQRNGDTYTISEGELDGMDEALGPEFEAELEELVQTSIGSIFSLVGKALFSGDGDFTDRMEKFSADMDAFGKRLEADMGLMETDIKSASEVVCQQVLEVAETEEALRESIPALSTYELFIPDHVRER